MLRIGKDAKSKMHGTGSIVQWIDFDHVILQLPNHDRFLVNIVDLELVEQQRK
jgi:hypothetical protein